MKVLLDECVPRKLRKVLSNHEVHTVTERGWSGLKNGELLTMAEAEFDVFLTVDQNLTFQQNLARFNNGLVLMMARNNRLKTLLPLIPDVNKAIEEVSAGQLICVG